MINKLNKKFNDLIKKEKLDRFDIYFRQYQDFEEIPLFSRLKHITFLSSLSFNEKNKLLINLSVKLIDCILANPFKYINSEEFREYFICLTITEWDDYKEIDCLTPCIYVSRRKTWILSNLKLSYQSSIEENLVNEYLYSLGLNQYSAFVPSGENGENKRIYIIKKNILNNPETFS